MTDTSDGRSDSPATDTADATGGTDDPTDGPTPDTAREHPDWFGAGTGGGGSDAGALGGSGDAPAPPEGADWFDDPTYRDPTPADAAPSAADQEAETDPAGTDASEGPDPEDGTTGRRTEPRESAAVEDDGGVTTGGRGADRPGAGPPRGRDDRGSPVYRDEQGRPVRRSREPESDDSGGIIAWLKRLFGLN